MALGIVFFDISYNLLIVLLTYSKIEFNDNFLILYSGLFKVKKSKIYFKDIKDLQKTGIELPGFKPFYALIPLKGLSYNPERDFIKLHKGYISDSDFLSLEKILKEKVNLNEKK